MRKAVFTFIILFISTLAVQSRDIYVSKSGDDNGPGTQSEPYETIGKAAAEAMPGDVVIIAEGTYEELLTPARSGTAGSPIVYRGKAGDRVIITAMQAVNNWSLDKGKVYKATVDWDLDQDNMALHNDVLMDLARWPNNETQNLFERDYLPGADVGSNGGGNSGGNNYFMNYSENGNSIPDWDWENGGSLHYYGGAGFLALTNYINSATPNRVDFTLDRGQDWIALRHQPGYTGHGVKKMEFFLQGIRKALDFKNEWYYNSDTKKLYVQIESGGAPEENTLRFRRRTQTINLNKNYIEVENLAVFGGSIDISGNNNKLYKVSSFYGNHTLGVIRGFDSRRQSVLITGSGNVIDQCEIAWGAGNGVYDQGNNNKLLNSYVHDFNYLGNYDCVLNTRGANGGEYRSNTLTRAGKDVIQGYVNGGEFAYNDISLNNFIADDGGLLYTTNVRSEKSSIHHNTFHDSQAREGRFKGAGIYLDNDAQNWDVHHNVVWNISWTNVQINWNGINLNIFNNTFAKGSATMGAWHKEGTAFSNVKVWNNLTDKEAVDQQGNQEAEATWEPQSDKQNNLVSKASMTSWANNDFTLKAGSEAVDFGRVIDGYTDGFQGASPDVGAYELGVTPFATGVDWDITTGPSSSGCYNLPGEVCNNVESVSFASSVSKIEQGTSINVSVSYNAIEQRDVVVTLLSPDDTELGNGKSTVGRGAGTTTIEVILANAPALGSDYKVEAAIRTVDGDASTDISMVSELAEVVADLPDTDFVELVDFPDNMPQTTAVKVTVNYESTDDRDIVVVVTDPEGNWLASSKVTVPIGAGTQDLTIRLPNLPEALPGYKFDATIRTVGGEYEDNTFSKSELLEFLLVTGIDDNELTKSLKVYPNPTSREINLNVALEWILRSSTGTILESGNSDTIDMSIYQPGFYILNIGDKNIKIIKNR